MNLPATWCPDCDKVFESKDVQYNYCPFCGEGLRLASDRGEEGEEAES